VLREVKAGEFSETEAIKRLERSPYLGGLRWTPRVYCCW